MSQVVRDNTGVIQAPANIMDLITQYLYSKGADYGKQYVTPNEKGKRVLDAIGGLTTTDETERWFASEDERQQYIDQALTEAENLAQLQREMYIAENAPNEKDLKNYDETHKAPTREED